MTLGRPEAYFFAYKDQGTTWAVRVDAESFSEARRVFGEMSRAERRRRTICAMEARDRDHTLDLGTWMASWFRRGDARRGVTAR